jgi:hypothetical protein
VITGVIIHIDNELPVKVDLEEMPSLGDLVIRCTNVRGVDGKRPGFVHDRNGTFLFPLHVVRLIEVPQTSESTSVATQEGEPYLPPMELPPELELDDEDAEEDLLARIRQI